MAKKKPAKRNTPQNQATLPTSGGGAELKHAITGKAVDRTQAEIALIEAKELSEKIIDTVRESMLVLDTELRVVSANQSFYQTFQVAPEETEGKLVYELGNNQWDIPELRQLLENVLPENNVFNDFEVDHHFESIGRKVMLLNARRVDHLERILLAIEEITERKKTELEIRESEQRFRAMADELPLMLWLHDAEGRQEFVNQTFCEYFGTTREQLQGEGWRQLIDPKDNHYVREFIDCVRKRRPFQAEVRVRRADGQWRWVESWGNPRFRPNGEYLGYVGGSADITERKQAEIELEKLNTNLEHRIEQQTEMLRLVQSITRSANEARTAEEAMRATLKQISQHNGWQIGHVWRLADDGSGDLVTTGIWHVTEDAERAIGNLREFQELCASARFGPDDFLVGTVAASSEARWIDDIVHSPDWRQGDAAKLGLHAVIAFPVTTNGQVVAVLEFFSDRPIRREERFMKIMPDVGIQLGHVLERKRLEKLVADAGEFEQRRIGGDIHDGVGQELTGLRFIAQTHLEALARQSSSETKTAQRISDGLEKVQQQLRQIVRKLVPVEIDELGLVAALSGLAEQMTQTQNLPCSFECSQSIRVTDSTLATHIFRIAQEAARNAARHSNASHVRILLAEEQGMLKLQIDDDGVGIQPKSGQEVGFGLRSMAYRAGLIGAQFDCQLREEGGTRVTCTVRVWDD